MSRLLQILHRPESCCASEELAAGSLLCQEKQFFSWPPQLRLFAQRRGQSYSKPAEGWCFAVSVQAA